MPPRLAAQGASVKKTRFLFCMLLLELALLVFQSSVRGRIRNERLLLAEANKSLSVERSSGSYRGKLIDIYGAEVTRLEAMLPRAVADAGRAFSLASDMLASLGIAGEIREKSHSLESVVLDVEGDSAYAGLSGFLCGLKSSGYTLRLNGLTVDALDGDDVHFTAEIEFTLPDVSSGAGQRR